MGEDGLGGQLGSRASREGTPILCLFSSPTRELEDYMSDRVQFVITAQEWDPSFEEVSPGGAGRGDLACALHPLHPLLSHTSSFASRPALRP